MYWLAAPNGDPQREPFTLLIDRSQETMNAVLDRVARYKKLAAGFDDLRMMGFAWDTRGLTVYRGGFLRELIQGAGMHIITLPAGIEVERIPDERNIPSVATIQICHQAGCPNPTIQFMVSGEYRSQRFRFYTGSVSLTLIEAAAAGIMQVDADYPTST